MGIYFCVNGGGKKVELSVNSVTHTALEVSTGENTLAKGNDTTCKLFVKGQINQGSSSTTAALNEIEKWAKQCNQKQDREVIVEQTYADFFHRKVIFPDARVVSFQEIFLTDNSKFMEISLLIEQKESKQDAISILYI